ncbi:MAG: TusE/DsrC/DsvC family sulfur relay protein [Gammaproteobacteria bacterium]
MIDPGDWSEGFAKGQAALEGCRLNAEHWEVIRFLQAYYRMAKSVG